MDISGKYRLIFWHKISMRQKLIETHENNEKPQKMINNNNNFLDKCAYI